MDIKKDSRIKIISWACYDLANTIFATNIISLYFPLWVTVQQGAADKCYIVPYYISMLAAALILPFLGILSDTLRRHSLFLAVFTWGCIVFTALVGFSHSLYPGIIFFACANFFNQIAGNVFYPALLPAVSSAGNIARVSGVGVAFGYIGTLIGLFSVRPFIRHAQYDAAFVLSACLFFVLSLPCFLFVRDEAQENKRKALLPLLKQETRKLRDTLRVIVSSKPALRFFAAILLAINGINGTLLNMGVYAKKVIGFSDTELPLFIAGGTVFAFGGSLLFGFIVERIGAKRTLSYVLCGWVVALCLASTVAQKSLFWVIGPCMGMLLAGTWVSSRPLVISLSPKHRVGEFFGFTGLASIAGALISPLLWLLTITAFEPFGVLKYRIAVRVLAVMIALGFFVLKGVPDQKLLEE